MICSAGRTRDFWLTHAALPAIAAALMLSYFSTTSTDVTFADSLFFDAPTQRWIGAGSWWAADLIHTGGRDFIRLLALLALGVWISGDRSERLRPWRGVAGYVCCCVVLTAAIAGLLKVLTNVDCPWDLSGFGGRYPYVHLFADRPDDLARARCFPGAHSASAFGLFGVYFAFRDRDTRLAGYGLVVALLLGALFSFAQQARGAHFLSHDLTSAFLGWFVCLGLYVAWPARQEVPAAKVSQLSSEPCVSPVLNQRMRCSAEPWVNDSGTTWPRARC